MDQKSPQRFPFLTCFNALKQQGFPLSPDDYQLFLQALAGGFGLESKEALLFLCQKLWLKNLKETPRFNSIVVQHIQEEITYFERKEIKDKSIKNEVKEPFTNKGKQSNKLPDNKNTDTKLPKAEEAKPDNETVKEQGPTVTLSIEDVTQSSSSAPSASTKESRPEERFILSGSYLALRKRDAETSWRFLRQEKVRTKSQELDINATINQIAKRGYFESPVYRFGSKNKAGVYILVDHRGSMAAYKVLSATIIEAASNGGRISVSTAYFTNVPSETIFSDMFHSKAFKLKDFLRNAAREDSSLLVISDAGAARGRYNDDRVDATEDFFVQAQKVVKHIAWVNPLPPVRWQGTSAQYIADFTLMFSADQKGLAGAIDVLRNKVNTG
jgi:hypothetical protein